MNWSEVEVVIIGGGAAGIAAAKHLHTAGVDCLLVEARERLGGRGFSVATPAGTIDLGCGWLHSAERNPWTDIAARQGRTIDKSVPPWTKPALEVGFPLTEQRACGEARAAFFERLEALAHDEADLPASAALIPGERWNALIRTTMSIIAGGELEDMSSRDFDNYADTETNWRVAEGFGAVIAAHATGVPVALDCAVTRIDHAGKRIRVETARGVIEARQVIVTLPTSVLVAMEDLFFPALPGKIDAARGLPLGLDDKLYLALEHADEFERDSRVFGRTDRLTGAYHMRPSGLPMIEAYIGGKLAGDLERGGANAFFDFAVSELSALFGREFARRLRPIGGHAWGTDPYARGAYSFARPGYAGCRQVLAASVDGRLFFAGEACSKHDFSTAHGAFLTGIDAAQQALVHRKNF